MASTRRQPPPVDIYQDPPPPILSPVHTASFDAQSLSMSSFTSSTSSSSSTLSATSMPRLQPSAMPLQALENSHSAHDVVFNPPSVAPTRPSPLKPRQSTMGNGNVAQNHLAHVPIPPPRHQIENHQSHSPLKKSFFGVGLGSQIQVHMPQQALFTSFQTLPASSTRNQMMSMQSSMSPPESFLDQENVDSSTTYSDNFADFPDPAHTARPTLKRALMDSAPLKDRSHKKARLSDSSATILPNPEDMPVVEDDGGKPQYSYATLIGMSILRAPGRRLTLAQIYKWIQDSFAYYRRADAGWQNSIRHNLSLNKAFLKQERPKDDPGKGHYWAIQPGMEHQFMKEKQVRRSTISTIPLTTQSPAMAMMQPSSTPAPPPPSQLSIIDSTPLPPAPQHPQHRQQSSKSHLMPPPPTEVEPSSDATLPASDPALHETDDNDFFNRSRRGDAPHSSPPPQDIHSSPPLAPASLARAPQGTPTPRRHTRVPSSGSHARKSRIAAHDSGYFSSLDSSTLKPRKNGNILISELDIEQPRIQRGRAEEELARLRSSSHDISPVRQSVVADPTSFFIASSPLHAANPMAVDPLTPAIKFKKPAKPPQSVSPRTNLRNHRKKIQDMLNSPIKSMGLIGEDIPWSPAFRMSDDMLGYNDNFHMHFDIFADPGVPSTPATGSPEKKSAKRPRFDRAVSANVLGESTNLKNKLSTPLAKAPKFKVDLEKAASPSSSPDYKRFLNLPQEDQDFFDSFDLFGNENLNFDDCDGVDILQGFPKIDVGKEGKSPRKALGSRPSMGSRSFTSRF